MTEADLPLLGTRFNIPAPRPGQVPRPRLADRLEEGARRKLTLLSAPPGFGKTTLLAEWLASLCGTERDVAWLSLDQADDDPRTFWRHTIAALARVRPAVAVCGASELLDGSQLPDDASLLTRLLNAIAGEPRDVVLFVDDYHLIESQTVTRGIAFLVEHMPPQLHLVLAGRADPALPLPRLRARGDLAEVRAADLRFTRPEAEGFLNGSMRLALAAEDIALLELRTEGWAGALQLAALSLQGRGEQHAFIQDFSGDDRYIVDYLVEEVLERQTTDVRDFLLRTSILDRLSAPLCDAVLGRGGSQAMLESLERANLFLLPLDDHRGWFRYHQLFSDVLRAHLRAEAPEQMPALHRLASNWHAAHGDVDTAIRHAIAARDFVAAAGLVELQAAKTMRLHHPDRLIQWLKPIPDEVLAAMPVLNTFYGHALQGMGDMKGSAARIDAAERSLAEHPETLVVFDRPSFEILPALIDVGRGYLAMAAGDAPKTGVHAGRALEVLPPGELHWRGTALALLGLANWHAGELGPAQQFHQQAIACFRQTGDTGLVITSAYHDAELQRARGRLREARQILESALAFIRAQSVREVRGVANLYLGLSELSCESGDLAAAAEHLAAAESAGIYPPRTPFRHRLASARLLECQGDCEGAEALLAEAAAVQVGGAVPDHRPIAAWRARLAAACGRLHEALAWARERGLAPGDPLSYAREPDHIAFAQLLLIRGTPEDAEAARGLLERLLAAAEAADRLGTAIEIRVLLAIALRLSGSESEALRVVLPALERAEPEGYMRVFVAEGPPVVPLLEAAAAAGITPRYCTQLLSFLAGSGRTTRPNEGSPDALSERELEVLRMLATELSGPEIAGTLYISLNTLRTHTRNIFAKLGVTSRRQAVARAAELRLL